MIDLILARSAGEKQTNGLLFLPLMAMSWDTIELPYIDNKLNVSSLKDGIYPYRHDYSNNKSRFVIELLATEPRSDIQIHAATRLNHLHGCIGVASLKIEKEIFDNAPKLGYIQIKTIKQ
jgi:hypothetical protein